MLNEINKKVKKGNSILEFTWNHTTLHARSCNPKITYLQAFYFNLATVEKLHNYFGEEIMMHLEFLIFTRGVVMSLSIRVIILVATTVYQTLSVWLEEQKAPPGNLINLGKYRLHFCLAGVASPTIIIDHSLGGIEGYFLIEELSQLARVCIYDRAGYGWSDPSPYPRTSYQIVQELDKLLTQAKIEPPYILVGDSFGSYNVRLYAHLFPEKVVGLVLTDGLHDKGMLKMSPALKALKLFFISGFLMLDILDRYGWS